MAVTWDQATWDAAYRIRIRDASHPQFGQTVGYSRLGMARAMGPYTDTLDIYVGRWANLVRDFGIAPADRILVGGSGFGFLIEAAKDAGFPNIWGVENSPYIASNGPTESRGDVVWVQDTFTGGGRVRTALRSLTGDDEFAWVITEDVLTSYTPAECAPLFAACETVLAVGAPTSHIVHMVSTPVDPPFTNLTLPEWKALEPTHSFVRLNLSAWEVL